MKKTTETKALLVTLQAKSGKEREVEQFLKSALPLVQGEPATLKRPMSLQKNNAVQFAARVEAIHDVAREFGIEL